MSLPQTVVVVFQSAYDVIKAKCELQKACIAHELIPIPKEISSECGMALKIEKPLLDKALELLRAAGVRYCDDLL